VRDTCRPAGENLKMASPVTENTGVCTLRMLPVRKKTNIKLFNPVTHKVPAPPNQA